MMQTLNSNPSSRWSGGSTRQQPARGRVARKAAEAACAPFFARTAPAGPITMDERAAMIDAVVEVVSAENGRLLPIRSCPHAPMHLLVEGWAYRSVMLPDGGRQITDILLPGDLYDWHMPNLADENSAVRACGTTRIAVLRNEGALDQQKSALGRAVEWSQHEGALFLQDRLVSLGRRDALTRTARILVELYHRLHRLGLALDGHFNCPMTQEQLADALGLTSVHLNRMLQSLRRCGSLTMSKRTIGILDLARLHEAAGIDREAYDEQLGG
jgi:CRP-like cAMP-binding protein